MSRQSTNEWLGIAEHRRQRRLRREAESRDGATASEPTGPPAGTAAPPAPPPPPPPGPPAAERTSRRLAGTSRELFSDVSGLAPDAGPATIAAATMAGSLTLFGFATAHPHPVAIAVGAAPAVTAAASVLVLGRWLEASSRPWRLRVPAKIPLVALLALAGVLSLARGGAASAADGGDGSTSRVVGGRVAEMATAVVGAGPVAQR